MEKNSTHKESKFFLARLLQNNYFALVVSIICALIIYFPAFELFANLVVEYKNFYKLSGEFSLIDTLKYKEMLFGSLVESHLPKLLPQSKAVGGLIIFIISLIGFLSFLIGKQLELRFPIFLVPLIAGSTFLVQTVYTLVFYSQLLALLITLIGLLVTCYGLNKEKLLIAAIGMFIFAGAGFFSFSLLAIPLSLVFLCGYYGYKIISPATLIVILATALSGFLGTQNIGDKKNLSASMSLSNLSDVSDSSFQFTDPVKFQQNLTIEKSEAQIILAEISFYFSQFYTGLKHSVAYSDSFYFSLVSHLQVPFFLSIVYLLIVAISGISREKQLVLFGLSYFLLGIAPRLFGYVTNPLISDTIDDYNMVLTVVGLAIFTMGILSYVLEDIENDIIKVSAIGLVFVFSVFTVFKTSLFSRTFVDPVKIVWNAIDSNPLRVDLYIKLSEIYKSEGKLNQAKEVYEKTFGFAKLESNIKILKEQLLAFKQSGQNEKVVESATYLGLRNIQEKNYSDAIMNAFDVYSADSRLKTNSMIYSLINIYKEGSEVNVPSDFALKLYNEFEVDDDNMFYSSEVVQIVIEDDDVDADDENEEPQEEQVEEQVEEKAEEQVEEQAQEDSSEADDESPTPEENIDNNLEEKSD